MDRNRERDKDKNIYRDIESERRKRETFIVTVVNTSYRDHKN